MRLYILLANILFSSLIFAQNPNFAPGELLVQFENSVETTAFKRQFETDQSIAIKSIDCISKIANIHHIRFVEKSLDLNQMTQTLLTYASVRIVQKNHFITNREIIPVDALFSEQWGLKNTGLDGGDIDADIDATDAWDISTGGVTTHGDTIVVCVLEGAGIEYTHDDLAANMWRNYGEIPGDELDNDGNGYIDDFLGWNIINDNDAVGAGSHGTRVASIIGAVGNNDIGLTGVNWNVKIMAVKGQVASDESSVIEAYSYPLEMRKLYNETFGEKGAFVVATNASWGIDNGDPDDSPLWCAMYDTLGKYGILNVGATTNNNLNVEESGDMPTNCTSDYFIGVTMTNNSDIRPGGGYGMVSVDLGAPGSNMQVASSGNSYSATSGTSYAAPMVTGSIGLAYASPCPEFISYAKYDPAGAALAMKGYILDGVDPTPALVDDVLTGGRLNVYNSMQLILDGCDEDACIRPFYVRHNEISDTSVDISWEGFSSTYIFTLSDDEGHTSSITLTDEFSISLDTLTPCTEYTISIVADCDGVLSEPSFPIIFTTDGCCTNPPLSAPTKSENSLTVEWAPILYASSYDLRYSIAGEEDWTELTDVSSPLLLDGLLKCQEYDVQIHTICSDSSRGYSESTVLRTLGCGSCFELEYCPVIGANDNLEWIESVEINGAVQVTGPNGGWHINEEIITALTPGESYEIKVTPGFDGGSFTERYSVYIDFDENGDFNPPIDILINDLSTIGSMVETISIPPGAPVGITKMRIGMSYDSDPVGCPESSFAGEYEDYCVYIGPQSSIDENTLLLDLFPNPAKDVLYIKSNQQINSAIVFSNDGKIVLNLHEQSIEDIQLNQLSPGIYIVQLTSEMQTITRKIIIE